MNRRYFCSSILTAVPVTALLTRAEHAGADRVHLSAAVTEYGMQEMADLVLRYKSNPRVNRDFVRQTARLLDLLDRHLQETGTLAELESRLRAGEQPGLDSSAIAEIWQRYGLIADRPALQKIADIPALDYARARSEGLAVHNSKLIQELYKRAKYFDKNGPEPRVARPHLLEDSGSGCFDCFCRIMRIEAALLGVAGMVGCAPCAIAAGELIVIESVLEYVFQLCSPGQCSNYELWQCNSLAL